MVHKQRAIIQTLWNFNKGTNCFELPKLDVDFSIKEVIEQFRNIFKLISEANYDFPSIE